MIRRCCMLAGLAILAALVLAAGPRHWRVVAAQPAPPRPATLPSHFAKQYESPFGQRPSPDRAPALAVEPYVRPEFAREMDVLRPAILEAARRHNRPNISRMTDREFAMVIALLLYNENFGSLEEQVRPLRALTPFYQDLQMRANEIGGSDLSVWPANLRPSVALEILRRQVPVPAPTLVITRPIEVAGSHMDIGAYTSRVALYTALTGEIIQPRLAVEYLAANLERGLYRAEFEGVPVTWRTLAAWHNQGIVALEDIRRNPTAWDYVRRTAAYLATARTLIDQDDQRVRYTLYREE